MTPKNLKACNFVCSKNSRTEWDLLTTLRALQHQLNSRNIFVMDNCIIYPQHRHKYALKRYSAYFFLTWIVLCEVVILTSYVQGRHTVAYVQCTCDVCRVLKGLGYNFYVLVHFFLMLFCSMGWTLIFGLVLRSGKCGNSTFPLTCTDKSFDWGAIKIVDNQ